MERSTSEQISLDYGKGFLENYDDDFPDDISIMLAHYYKLLFALRKALVACQKTFNAQPSNLYQQQLDKATADFDQAKAKRKASNLPQHWSNRNRPSKRKGRPKGQGLVVPQPATFF